MKKRIWAGRITSGFAALFLLVDGVMKLFKPAAVIEATVRLGYPENAITRIGLILIACTVIYLIPRTSALGALLLTGYLGGAIATHVRAGSGWFEMLFPVLIGTLVWGGLLLRDPRIRQLFPFTTYGDSGR